MTRPFGQDKVIAITGGAGFIGQHLVRRLCEAGAKVRVVDLVADPAIKLPGTVHIQADLRDFGQAVSALKDVDLVFHLAGNASGSLSVENPRLDFDLNALVTSNVGNAVLEVGARKLVYMSSATVYGTPQNFPISEDHPALPFLPYGATKLSGELTLRCLHSARGLPVVIGRSFVVYGPGENPRSAGGEVSQFLRWHLNGLPIPVVGDVHRKTRDFIHVYDLVSALLLLAERGSSGGIYNLGTGTEISMFQLGEAISAATGSTARLAANADITDDSFRLVADIGQLRGLGFTPSVTLEAGLRSLSAELGNAPALPEVKTVFRMQPAIARETSGPGRQHAGA